MPRLSLAGLSLGLALLVVAACSPGEDDDAATATPPQALGAIEQDVHIAPDRMVLPLSVWYPRGKVRAVIVAAHGMNDYRHAWTQPATAWADSGIVTYAHDQRGFGGSGQRGGWYGGDTLAADLLDLARLAAARHPSVPVFLMGESMGAAVAILAATRADAPPLAGVILAAPALWPASLSSTLLRQAAHAGRLLVPDWHLPPRGIRPASTDDPAILQQLLADPQMIHDTRLDTLAGVVDLMHAAAQRARRLTVPVLLLFGDADKQVDRTAVSALADALPAADLALYPGGRHLLFRSLGADAPTKDVGDWVLNPRHTLTSAAGQRGRLCRRQIVSPEQCPASMAQDNHPM